MGHFSKDALKQRVKDIESKYAEGAPDDEGESPDALEAERYYDDNDVGSVAVDDGAVTQEGEEGAQQEEKPAAASTEEDPFEARWKSRINVLAGKMRAEFGISSDAELDDSLTPEQRYKLMQADYNAAVVDRRKGAGYETAQQGGQGPASTGGDRESSAEEQAQPDEVEAELAALFGDEEIAKSLSKVVKKIAGKEAEGRVKPVESHVQRSVEAEFTEKVWGGPLAGIDHQAQDWADFNAQPVPFGGGKTMADVMREAHASRDFKTFETVRAEFERFAGKTSAPSASTAKGFASIATGGRRSAASVTSDNGNANIENLRAQLNQLQRAAERGEIPWAKVRELRSQLSAAYMGR